MTVAHLGVAVFIIGVTLVKGYETERDLRMVPGDKVAIGGYEFTFKGTQRSARARTTPRCAATSRCAAKARARC